MHGNHGVTLLTIGSAGISVQMAAHSAHTLMSVPVAQQHKASSMCGVFCCGKAVLPETLSSGPGTVQLDPKMSRQVALDGPPPSC